MGYPPGYASKNDLPINILNIGASEIPGEFAVVV
jgi:hypothetical protein